MCDCPQYNVTTYRHHYKPTSAGNYTAKAKPIKQSDETLITGYVSKNLQVNGIQMKSKVWPKSTIGVEEYKDFLKRLQCCKKDIYKLYFGCGNVDPAIVEEMLRDLERTTYQHVYSRNVFVPRKEARRLAKAARENPTNMKYYETTYRTYFNRIEELSRFKSFLYGLLEKHDQTELKNDLKKILKIGNTTYHISYCVPAIENSKGMSVEVGPIDRYTLRRI